MKRSSLLLWAFVALLACWRLDPAQRPITGDNQLYLYLAERAASGVAPHVSLVDTKSQLGVLTTAAAMRAGRGAGIDDVASSRAASIAVAATAVVLAGMLAALLTGSTVAGHVAALAMLASRGFADHAATGSNPKVFLAAFLLIALAALARGRRRWTDWAAGLAAGAAFLCWQPALLIVGAVALEAFCARDGSARRVVVVLFAALLPVAAYELYFALHGALGAQLHQEYAMTLGSVHPPRRLVRSLAFVATEGRGQASPLRVGPLAFAIVSAVAAVRLLREPRWLTAKPGALAFAVGGAAATAFTIYDHQGVPDLFFVAPFFAVAAGVLASAARGAPVFLALVLVLQVAKDDSLRSERSYSLADQRRVAGQVRALAEDRDVWVYEAVHLLGLAHLDNHVALALFYDDVRSVLDVDAWRPERAERMPGIVIHGRGGIPGSETWLVSRYVDATPAAFAAQGLRLWKARERPDDQSESAAGTVRTADESPRVSPSAGKPDPSADFAGSGPRPDRP
jgi:hypothetical protein